MNQIQIQVHQENKRTLKPIHEGIITAILCLLASSVSSYYIHIRSLNALQEEIKEGLLRNVSATATILDGDIHKTFISKNQKNDLKYIEFLKQMEQIRKASQNIRYIYTNVMINGKVYFVANPSPQNDNDNDGKVDEAPQLMDPYLDAGEALILALKEKRVAVDEVPYSDKWGTFYSAYAPFFDKGGNFVGTLGMDLELTNFEQRVSPIKNATAIAIIIGSILSILCGLQVWFFRRNQARYASSLAEKNAELAHSNEIIKKELTEAENYVKSLFPIAIQLSFPPAKDIKPVRSDWIYQSCSELGGDSFGYHWIDDDNFAIYLVDVCGHGVGAALHSVTVISAIRNMILPNIDFRDPAAVLFSLNNAFPMEKYNDTYFTIWYGVFNKKQNMLKYSSGGHPPAILINGKNETLSEIHDLSTHGMMIGSVADIKFQTNSILLDKYNRLYVFSDGVYEIDYSDGSGMMTIETFRQELRKAISPTQNKVKNMLEFAQKAQNSINFADDFTLVELMFYLE